MLVSCGTAAYYKEQRPWASSAFVWLDKAYPLGHPPSPPLFFCLSMSNYLSVSPALTGRKVLTANPQWWLGAVWGRGKALTSVTAFSAACYKSVTPDKMGTWIRHGTKRPLRGKRSVCVFMCMSILQLLELWVHVFRWTFFSLCFIFQPFVIR